VALGDASPYQSIRLYDPLTAELLLTLAPSERYTADEETSFTAVAFSPDGKLLAVGSTSNTILVWDIASRLRAARPPRAKLSAKDLKALVAELEGDDVLKAHRAIRSLAAAPEQAVPLVKARLRPVAPVAPARLARLIAQLDSDQFPAREEATRELERLGEAAGAALRQALAETSSPEVRKRAKRLLERLASQALVAGQTRQVRALKVLEHSGTPESQRALEVLARGAPGARLTREANASLERLARRRASAP
jgi:hypothetical protein